MCVGEGRKEGRKEGEKVGGSEGRKEGRKEGGKKACGEDTRRDPNIGYMRGGREKSENEDENERIIYGRKRG